MKIVVFKGFDGRALEQARRYLKAFPGYRSMHSPILRDGETLIRYHADLHPRSLRMALRKMLRHLDMPARVLARVATSGADLEIRQRALEWLGSARAPWIRPLLERMGRAPQPALKGSALTALLYYLPQEEAHQLAQTVADHPVPEVRTRAKHWLDPPAVPSSSANRLFASETQKQTN